VTGFLSAFFSVANLINVALSVAVIGILGVGMTAVIITGGIDLAVGSAVALVGIVAAVAANAIPWGPGAATASAVLAGLAVGAVSGAVTGTLVAQLRVPAFLATLALLSIDRGLAFVVGGGRSIGDLPPPLLVLGQRTLLGVPVPVWLMAAAVGAGWFILTRTVWGRWVYAVGGNEEATWLAGIDTRAVILWTYVVNGVIVGLAGLVLTARLGAAVPNAGLGYELDVIAAVVVGGTALTGGRGSVLGTLAGAAFIGVLNNALNLADVDPYLQRIAVGVVILAAVLVERVRTRG
jgi:ribose/xylose/arabinose/galactoside ABC-type transport system permease subunit